MILAITSPSNLDAHLAAIELAASRAIAALNASGSPLEALRRMKFDELGFHPIEGRPLNLIEQVNQTFTYLVALKAAGWLLERHPEAGGFRLAPGANAALPLDIMSVEPDLVGAETFAAVRPENNDKLNRDLAKLAKTTCRYRYAFFYCP